MDITEDNPVQFFKFSIKNWVTVLPQHMADWTDITSCNAVSMQAVSFSPPCNSGTPLLEDYEKWQCQYLYLLMTTYQKAFTEEQLLSSLAPPQICDF